MVKKVFTTLGITAVAMSVGSIEASAMEKGTINTSALNIRSGPSTTYSVIDKVYKGQSIELLESSNGWYKVKLSNGKIGWASSQYISKGITSNNTQVQGKKGQIKSGSRLNIRSGAGTSYSIVAKANNGEIVELLEKSSNGWYKIKLSNGVTGWGSSQYIVETTGSTNNSGSDNTQNPSTSTPIHGKRGKIKVSSKLNIRSGAGTSYSVVGKANNGEIVELLEKSNNGWYKIKLSNGVTGWGSSQYIVETTEQSGNSSTDNTTKPPSSTDKSAVVNIAYGLLGKPYQWGAEGPNSFDCSGFTQYVYKQAGTSIPRVSRDQAKMGNSVSRENYSQGDLVYFDTSGDGQVNHVGIYVGNNEFIHCSGTPSNPDKVKTDNLGSTYWSKALRGARRF